MFYVTFHILFCPNPNVGQTPDESKHFRFQTIWNSAITAAKNLKLSANCTYSILISSQNMCKKRRYNMSHDDKEYEMDLFTRYEFIRESHNREHTGQWSAFSTEVLLESWVLYNNWFMSINSSHAKLKITLCTQCQFLQNCNQTEKSKIGGCLKIGTHLPFLFSLSYYHKNEMKLKAWKIVKKHTLVCTFLRFW